jgi:hypothetical protein
MAITYYPQNSNTDTGCDNTAGANNPHDMSKTQGTPTTHTNDLTGITAYRLERSYQIDVSGDTTLLTGSQSYDVSLDFASSSRVNVRARLAAVDDTGCARTTSAYSSPMVNPSGIQTFSLTLNRASTDEDLELQIEAEQNNTHGTREFVLNVQDADTHVIAPEAAGGDRQRMIA